MSTGFVQIHEISKRFGGVQALSRVSLEIAAGEVHALCGENGAGKSTLIKILAGSCPPDAGRASVGGVPLSLGSVRASEAAGISVIHQEPVAFLDLSAAENIFVGREMRRFGGVWLERAKMHRAARQMLAELGEQFDPSVPTRDLALAQRQMAAIARALSRECRLLIMDEPTSSLSSRETAALFSIIRRLKSKGVGILYVSHRLEEIFELADRVTVLRDGRVVGTHLTAEIDRAELIRMMVGHDVAQAAPRTSRAVLPPAPVILKVRGLSRTGAFHDISLDVRASEVVGLAGLVGAGRSELARAVFGIDRWDAGQVTVAGIGLPRGSVRAAMRAGVALVPEDRQQQGLVLPMSVSVNLTLAVLRSICRAGFTSRRREVPLAERLMRQLAVRAAGPGAAASTLAGGNQQKLLLGKWLAPAPRVLLLDEPTRGVDVGAKEEVHGLIRRLAGEGMATLLISSDLPEIMALSDRIIVMRAGRIAGELTREEATQEKVLALALSSSGTDRGDAVPAEGIRT